MLKSRDEFDGSVVAPDSNRIPGWIRELLFLAGVGYLGATTFQYLEDNGASTIRQWVIVLLATACIVFGRRARS